MPLFGEERPRTEDELVQGDAATRALSVTAVENDFVEGVYEKLASVYDLTFGPTLHPGRVRAALDILGALSATSVDAEDTSADAGRRQVTIS